jgi:hypothetical protein
VLADACSAQLSDFFKRRRAEKKAPDSPRKRRFLKMTAGPDGPVCLFHCQTGCLLPPNTNCHPWSLRSLPLLM